VSELISSGAAFRLAVKTVQQVTGMNEIWFTQEKPTNNNISRRRRDSAMGRELEWRKSVDDQNTSRLFMPKTEFIFGSSSAPLFLTHKIKLLASPIIGGRSAQCQ